MIAKPLDLAFQAMLELENNLIKQGLSHDQFNDLYDAFCCLEAFAAYIEAKLKEKNQ